MNEAGLIDRAQAQALQAMVGFRNVLVYEYQAIDLEILKRVIEQRLGDLLGFAEAMLTI
jgi:uncharacterized protein YutE (UPF0331/DUF86 family)